jgi:hypothetical protein
MRFLCRFGRHSWAFVAMRDSRRIDIPMHTFHVCTLIERCRRCGLRWTRTNAPMPKRVRT